MKIQTVSYKRTKNLGNYENETLEISATLDEGEDPEAAILHVRERVDNQLSISESVQELKNQQIYLEGEVVCLEAQIKSATERWNKIQAFMNKLGVNLAAVIPKEKFDDDIPF